MITSVLAFIVAFGLLVLVHEFGHFWVAKRSGITIEKFSIGFGPKLFGFRRGGTEFAISLLPLGGFVKMKGEDGETPSDKNDPTAFSNKPAWVRSAVVLAGPMMNFLLSFVLMPLVFWLGAPESPLLRVPPMVGEVIAGFPAATAGIQAGDRIVRVGEKAIANWGELLQALQLNGATPTQLQVEREEKSFSVAIQPRWDEAHHGYMIGIQQTNIPPPPTVVAKRYPFFEAIQMGFKANLENIVATFAVLRKLITLQLSYKSLGGPVQIAYTLAATAASGLSDFIAFAAFLSVQLAVLNLLPIPVLDGGHVLFYLVEGVLRRPLSMKVRLIAQQVGLVFLVGLVLLVTWNDLQRLFF